MAKRELFQMFLKFILTQLTLLIIVEELNRIIQYSFIDFNYQIQGPYLLKTSKLPSNNNCHEFYNPKEDLVSRYGISYTHQQFMKIMYERTVSHGQGLEVPMAALSFIVGLIIQLIGFLSQNQTIVLLDNLFTILLPHFTLFINTVNWGDLCIEDSDIFNVVDYDMLGIVPIITFSWIVGMVVIFIILLSCQIHYNSPVIFIYGCFLCLLALYLITVDLISFYCSPKLVLILFECKFAVMAILLCSIYKVF